MYNFILGVVKRGQVNTRVLYLDNGVLMSARVPNNSWLLVLGRACFPRGVERAARHATQHDLGHELVRVTIDFVIRVGPQHSRCQATWGWGQGTVLVDTASAHHGQVITTERRRLLP
jgi:hypothetical protein